MAPTAPALALFRAAVFESRRHPTAEAVDELEPLWQEFFVRSSDREPVFMWWCKTFRHIIAFVGCLVLVYTVADISRPQPGPSPDAEAMALSRWASLDEVREAAAKLRGSRQPEPERSRDAAEQSPGAVQWNFAESSFEAVIPFVVGVPMPERRPTSGEVRPSVGSRQAVESLAAVGTNRPTQAVERLASQSTDRPTQAVSAALVGHPPEHSATDGKMLEGHPPEHTRTDGSFLVGHPPERTRTQPHATEEAARASGLAAEPEVRATELWHYLVVDEGQVGAGSTRSELAPLPASPAASASASSRLDGSRSSVPGGDLHQHDGVTLPPQELNGLSAEQV